MAAPSLFNTPPLSPSSQPQADLTPRATNSATPPPSGSPLSNPVPAVASGITLDELKQALPTNLRTSANQSLADTLNNITADPLMAANIRENFIGYTAILKEGKFKTEDYIHAVAYVSFKIMGFSHEDSYARTFPSRYASLIARGISKKDISAYVSAYHRGKLVNLIMDQSMIPTWVLNQDTHQKAINRLAELMVTANSEKVQVEAAIGLLAALKKPEVKQFQIDIGQTESSGMKEMRDTLAQLAQQQRQLIEGGSMKTIDVAATPLINRSEATDV